MSHEYIDDNTILATPAYRYGTGRERAEAMAWVQQLLDSEQLNRKSAVDRSLHANLKRELESYLEDVHHDSYFKS